MLNFLTRLDATEQTQRMLTDTCLNGLLFTLVRDKWLRWGRFYFVLVYVWPKLLLTALLTCLASPSLFDAPALPYELAPEPPPLGNRDTRPFAWGVLGLAAYQIGLELFEVWLGVAHWRRLHPMQREGCRAFASSMLWARTDRYAWLGDVSTICSLGAAAYLLGGDGLEGTNARRQTETACVTLSVAVVCAWMYTALECVVWHEGVGIFAVLVGEMLRADVLKFMLIYLPSLFGFGAAFAALFPQPGPPSRGSSLWSSIENLVILSLIGEPPEIAGSIYPTVFMESTLPQRPFNQAAYYVLYLCFLVLVLVLLLNLLIAMMGRTYTATMEDATLKWRLKFARLVLRLETLARGAGRLAGPCARTLQRTIADPTYWPAAISFGAGAHAASSYLDSSYVFRVYADDTDNALMMHGLRGDPFQRHGGAPTRTAVGSERRAGDGAGGGAGGGGGDGGGDRRGGGGGAPGGVGAELSDKILLELRELRDAVNGLRAEQARGPPLTPLHGGRAALAAAERAPTGSAQTLTGTTKASWAALPPLVRVPRPVHASNTGGQNSRSCPKA